MLHETAHSYIRFIYGFNNDFSKKINLLGTPKNSNYDDLLDSVEHFGIRFSEQTFGNLNYLSHTVSFDNPANLVDSKSLYFYFNKLSPSSQNSINKLINFLDPLFRRKVNFSSYSILPR
jgi:hypothetical protein